MPVHNSEIAAIFNELAELLEIEGANRFRVRAYRNAAITIANLPESMAAKVEAGEDLPQLPTIGKDLAAKIAEIVATGHLTLLDQLEKSMPGDLVRIAAIPGLGPKRVRALHEQAAVKNIVQGRYANVIQHQQPRTGRSHKFIWTPIDILSFLSAQKMHIPFPNLLISLKSPSSPHRLCC